MDMRATQSPIESTHNTSVVGTPPKLGTPTPGTTGGLPAVSGLSVLKNPMAQQLQSMGRGQDSMLVHMTPEEVNSLQGLALATGGSLTINPHTGLPEAGWLGKLLPTLLGFGLNFIPGVGPLLAAGITAAGTTAVTGDLQKGLMAGLGAYGGASLGNALNLGTQAAKTVATTAATGATGVTMPTIGIQSAGSAVPTSIGAGALGGGAVPTSLSAGTLGSAGVGLGASLPGLSPAVTAPLNLAGNAAGQGATGIVGKFGAAAREGLKAGTLPYKIAPYAAGMGLLNTVSELSKPNLPKYTPEKQTPYVPMGPGKREVRYPTPEELRDLGSAEFTYFTPSNPEPVPLSQSQQNSSLTDEIRRDYGYADGGLAALPAPQGFNDLMNYFGATNPGAVTASMYPTSAAPAQPTTQAPSTAGAEQIYNFSNRTPTTAGTGTGTTAGTGTGMNFDFSDLANIDWTNVAEQFGYSPTTPAKSTTPTTPVTPTAPTTPIYGDWRDSWMPRNNTTTPAQPTAPNYDFGNSGNSFYAPEDSGFGGYDFSQSAPQNNFYADTSMSDQPSYDFGNYDYNQSASQPDYSGFDYSQFTPQPSYDDSQYFSATPEPAPSYDYSQFAPQPESTGAANFLSNSQQTGPVGYFNEDGNFVGRGATYQFGSAPPPPPTGAPNTNLDGSPYTPMYYDYGTGATSTAPSYDDSQYFSATPEPAPSYDYNQYFSPTPAAPSYDDSQYFSAMPAAPSYDYSQFAPQPDYSGFDYSQFAPQAEPAQQQQYMPQTYAPEPAPSYDYSQFAPQAAPSYDFNQFNEQSYPAFDGFYDSNYMASGGSVDMGNGSFVVDARTVSELGNGSSNDGREILARMGGRPLDGPGDGVSDSIPARIGGSQKARVARDEVIMPPQAVRRIGGGSEKRGTQKLYALMDKAHKARKTAKRGQDTKLAKGLGALA